MTKETIEQFRRQGGYVHIPAAAGRELADAQEAYGLIPADGGGGNRAADAYQRLQNAERMIANLVGSAFRQ